MMVKKKCPRDLAADAGDKKNCYLRHDSSHPFHRQLIDRPDLFWRWYAPARRDYNSRAHQKATLADIDQLRDELKKDIAQLATRRAER